MNGEPTDASVLYNDLSKSCINRDYEKTIKCAQKILKSYPDEEKAFCCYIVALIQLSRFQDALQGIYKFQQLSKDLIFERAYCEYRTNKTKEALQTILKSENPSFALRELQVQLFYRLERYDDCLASYKNLIRNAKDSYDEERQTNLFAVLAAQQLFHHCDSELPQLPYEPRAYETFFNAATHEIGRGNFNAATKTLSKAEALCCQQFEDEPEELSGELSAIRVQRGYIAQKGGNIDESSLDLYTQALKEKDTDASVTAVAANNVVTIHREQNVFDSKKKMKLATSDSLRYKLTSSQQRQIAFNQALLMLHTGQTDQLHRQITNLKTKYPGDDMPALISAAAQLKVRQTGKAISELVSHTASKVPSVKVALTLAALFLSQGHVYKACDVLKEMPTESRWSPGIIGCLVSLYLGQDDRDNALNVLKSSVEFYQNSLLNNKTVSCEETLLFFKRAYSSLLMRCGRPTQAAQVLEELHKQLPKDIRIMAQLISAYSKFDPKKAHAISRTIPTAEDRASQVDAARLEEEFAAMISKSKRLTKRDQAAGLVTKTVGQAGGEPPQKKRKKKKKPRLPKNYDPEVAPDPERWLPRRERSTFRPKRRDKRRDQHYHLKGPQGAVTGSADLDKSTPATSIPSQPQPTTPAAAEAGSPVPSKPKPRPQQQKKKKRKGGKW